MFFNCEGLTQGGADCLTRRAHFGLVFCSPVRGPALRLVSPKGSSSRTRAAPCLPPPSPLNEASISGPTASFCPLPPNHDQMVGVLGWQGSSRQQTQVSCRCLPMFVRHTSSKEIARCKSVRSGRVGTSHDPTALAVFFLQPGTFLHSRKFSQTDSGKQRDIGVNRCTRHMW